MASLKTKFTVGLFMLIGVAVAVVAITWLGMSHYFEGGNLYVAYFDESVQGLDKDSPVKYRGVPVGRVERIGVAPDSVLIEVTMKIETGLELKDYTEDITAQLKSIGITGIMFIGLDRKRHYDPERAPTISFTPEYPLIVTIPSDIKRYMEGLEDVLDQLGGMDVGGISSRVKLTLDGLNQSIEGAQLEEISTDFRSSLSKLNNILDSDKWDRILASIEHASGSFDTFGQDATRVVARLDRIVAQNEAGITQAIKDFQAAMKNADRFMENGSELIKQSNSSFATLVQQLLVTEQNLETASESLNRFLELIADQPSQLIFGEPPPARKLAPTH
ncbi:MAG: MlaD family protein [Desulfobacterales bacterium]